MTNNQLPADVQLPVEVKKEIEEKALALYPPRMASPRFMVEVDMNEDKRFRWIAGATAYATKLHQCRQLLIEFTQAYEDGALKWRAFEIREKAKTFLNGE